MKYIIDLDGTLLSGEQANLDSVVFINSLQAENRDFIIMTNSIKSPQLIQQKLDKVGIAIETAQIMNPINAINSYLKHNHFQTAYVVGTQLEIDQLEVAICQDRPEIVILLDFEKGNIAYNGLQVVYDLINEGIPVITASLSPYYLKNDKKVLDTGAFVRLLEAASNITIEVFGKPSPEYFKAGLRLLNASPDEVLVIGDDWQTDAKGASAIGCKTVLLQSGKYKTGDEALVPEALCVENLMAILV